MNFDWLYITKSNALSKGFTHYGKMYSAPVWLKEIENYHEGPVVVAKMAILEYWIQAATAIDIFLCSIFQPEKDGEFKIEIHGEIEP